MMVTYGFAFGYSDLVTLDENFPAPSSFVYVSGTAGDIVFENTIGQAQYFPGAISGMLVNCAARRILTSGTVNGTLRTTTATGLVYCSSGIP